MLSEVVYYLDAGDVERLVDRVRGSLAEAATSCSCIDRRDALPAHRRQGPAELFVDGSNGFLRADPPSRQKKYRIDVLRLIGPHEVTLT